jgi:hypothetical protein
MSFIICLAPQVWDEHFAGSLTFPASLATHTAALQRSQTNLATLQAHKTSHMLHVRLAAQTHNRTARLQGNLRSDTDLWTHTRQGVQKRGNKGAPHIWGDVRHASHHTIHLYKRLDIVGIQIADGTLLHQVVRPHIDRL